MRILKFNTPPKHILRLFDLPTFFVCPSHCIPRFGVVPTSTKLGECGQQTVRTVSRGKTGKLWGGELVLY